MFTQLNFNDFDNWFRNSGSYSRNFSYEARRALFDYLEELEDGTDTKIEFDPIALCCEYSEYESLDALRTDHPSIETLDELEEFTTVIRIGDGESFLIQQF